MYSGLLGQLAVLNFAGARFAGFCFLWSYFPMVRELEALSAESIFEAFRSLFGLPFTLESPK